MARLLLHSFRKEAPAGSVTVASTAASTVPGTVPGTVASTVASTVPGTVASTAASTVPGTVESSATTAFQKEEGMKMQHPQWNPLDLSCFQ